MGPVEIEQAVEKTSGKKVAAIFDKRILLLK
jgi:hypothetical protein